MQSVSRTIGELRESLKERVEQETEPLLGLFGANSYTGLTTVNGGVLSFNVAHHNETYGTMVPYMRAKGIVPPSSDNTGKGKAK